jgi:hypothetical protein
MLNLLQIIANFPHKSTGGEKHMSKNTPNKLNTKIIVIIAVVAVVAIVAVAAVLLTSGPSGLSLGGGLSGKYYMPYDEAGYIEFRGGNNVRVYQTAISSSYYYDGTYTLDGNQITIKLTISSLGQSGEETMQGTVSDDKQQITISGQTFTKR